MGTLHSKLYSLINQIMRMGTQYTVNCIGLINQILRIGTLHSTLSRFNKSDFENGYTRQHTV